MMRDTPFFQDMPSSILSSPFFTSHQQQQTSPPPQQPWSQHLESFVGKDDDGYRIGHNSNQYKNTSTWYDSNSSNFSSQSKPQAGADFDHHHHHHHHGVFYGGKPYRGFQLKSCHGGGEDMLDFSSNKSVDSVSKRTPPEKGRIMGVVGKCKKSKSTMSPPPQPPLKVRKEKLGDRITALHQLVSPFGKTDTASVLLEAIGYIRFLQGQVEALSSPYVRKTRSQQYSVEHEGEEGGGGELRGRGLCLVPVPQTGEIGDDYWCTSIGGGGGGGGL